MDLKIKLASIENLDEIMKIYQSLIGFPGCTWDEEYPSRDYIKDDINKNSLYVVLDNNKIIATAYAGRDDDFNLLKNWNKEINNPCLLARVAVLKDYQNRGIAKMLLKHIEKDVSNRGFDGIHFIVSTNNDIALKLYTSMGYSCCGEATILNMEWFCFEKKL